MFLLDKLDHFNDFSCLLNLWNWYVNGSFHHCSILHARHDAHSDGFLRHLRNHDVDDLFNDDALLTLAVYTATHLVQVSTVRSIILSCGIASTFLSMERRSPRSFYPSLHLFLELLLRNLANVLILRNLDSLLHQLVGRGNLLRYHVCRTTYDVHCLVHASLRRYFAFWALVWATHGLRVYGAPMYLACHCRDPLECPSKMASGAERQPFVVVLHGGGGLVLWTSCIHAFFKHASSTDEVMLLSLRIAP